MASTASTTNPDVHVIYADYNPANEMTRPGVNRSSLNNMSDVVILAAPIENPTREIRELTIYNKDSSPVIVTVKTDNGTTERIIVKQSLSPAVTLVYTYNTGWVRF